MRLVTSISFIAATFLANANAGDSALDLPERPRTGFLENKGQLIDQSDKPNAAVHYLLPTQGLHVQLRTTGFSYEFLQAQFPRTAAEKEGYEHRAEEQPATPLLLHRVDIDLVGAALDHGVQVEGRSTYHYNYYTTGTPEGGVKDVHDYQRVVYQNVYPGIDLEFLTTSAEPFKYNFIVHPGGHLDDIRLRFSGASSTELTAEGIRFGTRFGSVLERIPECHWDSGSEQGSLEGAFVQLGPSEFGMRTQVVPPANATVIIDPIPQLLWGTCFGGMGGGEAILDAKLAADGMVLFAGWSNATTNLASAGAFQDTLAGQEDGFFGRFDGYDFTYCTYYGGSMVDHLTCVDQANSLTGAVAGWTDSDEGIEFNVSGTTGEGYLASFQLTDGFLIAGRYTSRKIQQDALVADGVYAYVGSTTILADGRVEKIFLFADMAIAWSTVVGCESDHQVLRSIDVAPNGEVYVGLMNDVSWLNDESCATAGVLESIPSRTSISKLTASGEPVWLTYIGGPTGPEGGQSAPYYNTEVYDLAVDGDHIFIVGRTSDSSFTTTPNAFQPTFGGFGLVLPSPSQTDTGDGFLMALDSSGTFMHWSTYFGLDRHEIVKHVAVGPTGDLFAAGTSRGGPGYYTVRLSTLDAMFDVDTAQMCFVAKFNRDGIRQWTTGWMNVGFGNIDASENGDVLLCGAVNSDTPGQPPPLQAAWMDVGQGGIAYMGKFRDCDYSPTEVPTLNGPATVCAGDTGLVYSTGPHSGDVQCEWSAPIGSQITYLQGDSVVSIQLGWASGDIHARYRNACGTSADAIVQLVYGTQAQPTISVVGDSVICFGDSVLLVGQGALNYQWSNGAVGDSIYTSMQGYYHVTATDTAACPGQSNVVTLIASPEILVDVVGPDTVFANEPVIYQDTVTYMSDTWSTSGQLLDHFPLWTISEEVSWALPGMQWVALTFDNSLGCTATDTMFVYVISTDGLSEGASRLSQVEATVAHDELTVTLAHAPTGPIVYRVLNALGQCLHTGRIQAQRSFISLGGVAEGSYLLELAGAVNKSVRFQVVR